MKSKIEIAGLLLLSFALFAVQRSHAEEMLASLEGDRCKFFPRSDYQLRDNGVIYPQRIIEDHAVRKGNEKRQKEHPGDTAPRYWESNVPPDPNMSFGYKLETSDKILVVNIDPNKGKQNIVYVAEECKTERYFVDIERTIGICKAQALTQEEYDKLRQPPDQQKAQQPRPDKKILCVYTPGEAAQSESRVIAQIMSQIQYSPEENKQRIPEQQAIEGARFFYKSRGEQVANLSKEFETAGEAKQTFEGSRGGVGTPRETGGVRLGGTTGETLDTGSAQVQETQQALSNAALENRPEPVAAASETPSESSPLSNAAKTGAGVGLAGGLAYALRKGIKKYKEDAQSIREAVLEHPGETASTFKQAYQYNAAEKAKLEAEQERLERENKPTRDRVEAKTKETLAEMKAKEEAAETEAARAREEAENLAKAQANAQERLEKYKKAKENPFNLGNLRTYAENRADPLQAHNQPPSDSELLERFTQEELAKQK
ncbi:MAG: hypothetical protein A3G41_06790 [Elusimicrobia bacterium RIFCSPLOWO2_12_FULL_59_9]|nr:MAG: hypothetical protein A3G41_06790 [Elusimicrobia bacterium RIFCSPLOWO2_12_FULL_59_9]